MAALTGGESCSGRADLGAGNDVVGEFSSRTFDGCLGSHALTLNANTSTLKSLLGIAERFKSCHPLDWKVR